MSVDIKAVEAPENPNIPELRTGDTVSVHVKIKEGNRERIQEFKGTILYMHRRGQNSTFTVRRLAASCSAHRASIKLWSNATTRPAAPASTSCAIAPARARASNRNSHNLLSPMFLGCSFHRGCTRFFFKLELSL
jgi:ribosomal protein L19